MRSQHLLISIAAAAALGIISRPGMGQHTDASAEPATTSARRASSTKAPMRVVVSLKKRHVWAIRGSDTVLSAPAAVAKGTTLEYAGQEWTFKTPRGVRHVLSKSSNPVWNPPDWMYAEVAAQNGLRLAHVSSGKPVRLSDGRQLTVRHGVAGVIEDGQFMTLPLTEHIVFDNKLFIPPLGSKNRKIEGQLGKYRLDLGDGYMLHGTPYKASIGRAATHGCIRLRDADIEWLYRNVPVGAAVEIR